MTSYHPALRLSPSNSPYFKAPSPRSPTKTAKADEPGLHLRRVNGTTTASANAFDCLPAANKFVYTAGAAAVIATIDDDLNVTQTFFRANPNSANASRDAQGTYPSSPSPGEPRNRALGNVKEHGHSTSPIALSGRDWLDSPGRTNSAKDRIKAATSVAISPNGKWLAIGETGYRPRILIFSAREGSSESPTAIVAEHTFGVHALKFSPDSKSLASLGTVNDGFIYVWAIDERTGAATLSASNKCTSIVHCMLWMGRSVITAGLRFAKIWRPDEDNIGDARVVVDATRASAVSTPRNKTDLRASDFGNSILSPKHRALAGKNSLLGDLLEATFTCAVAIADAKAIVCSESGDICLLDDTEKTQSLTLATNAGHRVTAVRFNSKEDVLYTIGADGHVAMFTISQLEKLAGTRKQRRQSNISTNSSSAGGATVIVSAAVGNAIVEVDTNRVIRLSKANAQCSNTVASRHLTAHQDAVLGVRPWRSSLITGAAFFTFSANGTIHFWNEEGTSVAEALRIPVDDAPEMYGLTNELKSVTSLSDGTMLASGDRYGTLTLVDVQTRRVLHQVRAHSAEVLDLLAFDRDGVQYLASASRDRTVQLFVCSSRLELSQTMDEHAGAVTGLLLSGDGEQLLSCSADRSIVVRQSVFRASTDPSTLAFAMLRAITVKSSPTSMCLTTQDDTVLISTVDRCIGKYSTKTGQPGFSFKCGDNESGEAVAMSKILYAPSLNGNPTISCVSSSDKSLRLYSEYGSLIARDWGHTEGITDMAIVQTLSKEGKSASASPQIVTVAADSTIFMWDSTVSHMRSNETSGSMDDGETPTSAASIPLRPPLRKVISYSEMSRFRREKSMEERDPPSPSANGSSALIASPQKLRKKSSRPSLAQPPRLEPGFRSTFDPSRRKSMRHRSPSPPSPRASSKKELQRRPSVGVSLRSKSTDNLLPGNGAQPTNNTGFGSLTASTESVCRTLRAYRKKLTSSNSNDKIMPDALRELEKELKLTARAVGEKSQSKNIDEAVMARLLDQASDKIVGLLDQKIKERVEDEVRRNGDSGSTSSQSGLDPPTERDEYVSVHVERSDTAPGALETLRPRKSG